MAGFIARSTVGTAASCSGIDIGMLETGISIETPAGSDISIDTVDCSDISIPTLDTAAIEGAGASVLIIGGRIGGEQNDWSRIGAGAGAVVIIGRPSALHTVVGGGA